jgi:hypothetical protein
LAVGLPHLLQGTESGSQPVSVEDFRMELEGQSSKTADQVRHIISELWDPPIRVDLSVASGECLQRKRYGEQASHRVFKDSFGDSSALLFLSAGDAFHELSPLLIKPSELVDVATLRVLGVLACRDVELYPLVSDGSSRLIARQDRSSVAKPYDSPVLRHHSVFHPEWFPGVDRAGCLGEDVLAVVLMESANPQGWIVRPLVGAKPEDRFDLWADVLVDDVVGPAAHGPDVHDGRELFHERAERLLEVQERLVRLATVCSRHRCHLTDRIRRSNLVLTVSPVPHLDP